VNLLAQNLISEYTLVKTTYFLKTYLFLIRLFDTAFSLDAEVAYSSPRIGAVTEFNRS
jgi:hypothetical protein